MKKMIGEHYFMFRQESIGVIMLFYIRSFGGYDLTVNLIATYNAGRYSFSQFLYANF